MGDEELRKVSEIPSLLKSIIVSTEKRSIFSLHLDESACSSELWITYVLKSLHSFFLRQMKFCFVTNEEINNH